MFPARFPRRAVCCSSALFLAAALSAQTKPDALAAYLAGNYERALSICRDEIRAEPANLEAHVVICWSLIALRRYGEALDYAETGRRLGRFDPRVAEILGEIAYYQNRNADALKYFQEYLDARPEGERVALAYYLCGEVYLRTSRFRRADIALSAAVRLQPGSVPWWLRLGFAREQAGDLAYAAEAYERALSLDARSADAERGLRRVRQRQFPQ